MSGAPKYDLESFLSDIASLLATNLNSKLTEINTEKNDSITLDLIDSSAYVIQSLNGVTLNYDPFVFYGVQDIQSESIYGSVLQKVDVVVAIVKTDTGQDVDIANRMFRYGRALKEIFEDGFEIVKNGTKMSVKSLIPIDFGLMNQAFTHRAIGVLIQAEIA